MPRKGQRRSRAVGAPQAAAGEAEAPQRKILDRYRLEEQIATGGMAEVWRAEDEVLSRPVAVKLLHQHLLPDEASRRRFEKEARAAASLSQQGIVTVYDVSVTPDEAAIVLEFVPGEGLDKILERRGGLPEVEAVGIAAQVADALEHAHRRGVIHRDVKPDNILLDRSGQARLVDFGIARVASDAAQRLTLSGTSLGTLRYMAPEQLAGAPGDARTDVFGLGVTLYKLLAGRAPFDADAPAALIRQQQARPPAIPGVSSRVMNAVWDALDPDPAQRPQTAAELAARLRAGDARVVDIPERSAAATSVNPASEASASVPAATTSPASGSGVSSAVRSAASPPMWQEAPAALRRSRWEGVRAVPIGAIALLLVAVLIVGAVVVSGRPGGVGGGSGPTRTFPVAADARIATTGSFNAGAGGDGTLPVGQYREFLYRSLLRFENNWSGMRRIIRIELRLRTSTGVRVARGGSPTTVVRRNVSRDWQEGSATELSSRNAVTWASRPQATNEDQVRFDGPGADEQSITVDVTRLYLPLAPRNLGGQAAPNLGITLLAGSDGGANANTGDTTEFWSREAGAKGPQLIVTFQR